MINRHTKQTYLYIQVLNKTILVRVHSTFWVDPDTAEPSNVTATDVYAIRPSMYSCNQFTSAELMLLGVDIPTQLASIFDLEPLHPNINHLIEEPRLKTAIEDFWSPRTPNIEIKLRTKHASPVRRSLPDRRATNRLSAHGA